MSSCHQVAPSVVSLRPDQIRLLWVDDEPRQWNAYHAKIRSSGMHLHLSQNVRDAREALEQQEFDIVITDMMFPRHRPTDEHGYAGFEVLRIAKAKGIQAIVLSVDAGRLLGILPDSGHGVVIWDKLRFRTPSDFVAAIHSALSRE